MRESYDYRALRFLHARDLKFDLPAASFSAHNSAGAGQSLEFLRVHNENWLLIAGLTAGFSSLGLITFAVLSILN